MTNLGFSITDDPNQGLTSGGQTISLVPSFRANDINIPEDVIEEVARVYGYHNIPSVLQPATYVSQPKDMEDLFVFQNRIKNIFKTFRSKRSHKLLDDLKRDDRRWRVESRRAFEVIQQYFGGYRVFEDKSSSILDKNIKENQGKRTF